MAFVEYEERRDASDAIREMMLGWVGRDVGVMWVDVGWWVGVKLSDVFVCVFFFLRCFQMFWFQ